MCAYQGRGLRKQGDAHWGICHQCLLHLERGKAINGLPLSSRYLTKRDHEVVENTRSCVKNKTKLTNLMKITRIEGYNGKYGSNPQGIREISDDLFEFDQIAR